MPGVRRRFRNSIWRARPSVFIFAETHGVPWPVESYLMRGKLLNVPQEAPDLPGSVTAAWIAPSVGTDGLYWDGEQWRIINVA